MRAELSILFILTIIGVPLAQESPVDSLKAKIAQAESDTTKVQSMLSLAESYFSSDPNIAISISEEAYTLSNSIDYGWGMGYSLKNIGNGYYFLSDNVSALAYWNKAKLVFEEINDRAGVANMFSNISVIYSDEGFLVKALEVQLNALEIAEEIKDSNRIATVTQNIGALHHKNYNFKEAILAYKRALPIFEALDKPDGIGLTNFNLADLYFENEQIDSARMFAKTSVQFLEQTPYYPQGLSLMGLIDIKVGNYEIGLEQLKTSYELALSAGYNIGIAESLNKLGLGYEEIGDLKSAIEVIEEAKLLSLDISDTNSDLDRAYEDLIRLYSKTGNSNKVDEYSVLHKAIKDSLINIESLKAQNKLLFDFEISKREQEIALLLKDKEIQKGEEARQKLIKNGFVIGFLAVLVFASVFLIQRNKIKKGKTLSDNLLHNILPSEVAEELKEKGESVAKNFEDVSVLFSDFKGFTGISEKLSAQELVSELNTCFKAFDNIITSHGLEKIKTIGDSYMAAGGLHIPRTSSTNDVIMAGLAMQEYIIKRKVELESKNKPFFEMRVGIHTGPVVAGIVGIKKFQYDIWGDTVNTASRMESNGEIGRVNISQFTFDLIKDDPNLSFEKRGKVQAKGKGELYMYFVNKS